MNYYVTNLVSSARLAVASVDNLGDQSRVHAVMRSVHPLVIVTVGMFFEMKSRALSFRWSAVCRSAMARIDVEFSGVNSIWASQRWNRTTRPNRSAASSSLIPDRTGSRNLVGVDELEHLLEDFRFYVRQFDNVCFLFEHLDLEHRAKHRRPGRENDPMAGEVSIPCGQDHVTERPIAEDGSEILGKLFCDKAPFQHPLTGLDVYLAREWESLFEDELLGWIRKVLHRQEVEIDREVLGGIEDGHQKLGVVPPLTFPVDDRKQGASLQRIRIGHRDQPQLDIDAVSVSLDHTKNDGPDGLDLDLLKECREVPDVVLTQDPAQEIVNGGFVQKHGKMTGSTFPAYLIQVFHGLISRF